MMSGYDMNGWGWAMMALITVVVIVGIAGFVWLLGSRRSDERRPSAIELLDERLARGEISTDEYAKLRGTLTREPATEGRH